MAETNFDIQYKSPGNLKKSELFLKYQLRQFFWRVQDVIEDSKNSSNLASEAYDINNYNSLKKSWEDNGFVILKSKTFPESIDLVNEEISNIRKCLPPVSPERIGDFGYPSRIFNAHSISRIVFKFINDHL